MFAHRPHSAWSILHSRQRATIACAVAPEARRRASPGRHGRASARSAADRSGATRASATPTSPSTATAATTSPTTGSARLTPADQAARRRGDDPGHGHAGADRVQPGPTGFTVSEVTVDGAAATFSRTGDELTVTPAAPLRQGPAFKSRSAYAGVPEPVRDSSNLGTYGFIPTPDGAFVACEPNGARTWFPGNDHPADKATYDFEITVPEGRDRAGQRRARRRAEDRATARPPSCGARRTRWRAIWRRPRSASSSSARARPPAASATWRRSTPSSAARWTSCTSVGRRSPTIGAPCSAPTRSPPRAA